MRKRFSEEDLLAIIISVIKGMAYLQSNNIKHQHLTSSNLFYNEY